VVLVSAAVGAVVTFVAARAAGGQCGAIELGHTRVAADPVCDRLVRTLATRMGMASAVATIVILLTMAGLARLAAGRPAQERAQAPGR
jgi:hypothetical protein